MLTWSDPGTRAGDEVLGAGGHQRGLEDVNEAADVGRGDRGSQRCGGAGQVEPPVGVVCTAACGEVAKCGFLNGLLEG